MALELERQAENRHLYQTLGLAATVPTGTAWLLEHHDAQVAATPPVPQTNPVSAPKPNMIQRSSSSTDDLPDFDIF